MLFYSIMTFLGFSAASATAASFNETDTHHWTIFQNFVHKFDKSYTNLVEFEKRFDIFRDNLHYIREQNGMNNKYELGVTRFADLTIDEFSSLMELNKEDLFLVLVTNFLLHHLVSLHHMIGENIMQ